jgi:hypothetical protein
MTSQVVAGSTRGVRHCRPRFAIVTELIVMRTLLIIVTTAFTAFTLWVLSRTGLVGFYEQILSGPAGWQIFADIAIALAMVLAWIWYDAQAAGRRFWPYAVLTLALGSIGPLLYLLLGPVGQRRAQAALHEA